MYTVVLNAVPYIFLPFMKPRMLKLIGSLSLALTALAGSALGYRAFRQHQRADALTMHQPGAITEAGFVRIGGVDQWVQIRGENSANPLLLVLHGGPGMSYVPFTPWFKAWEEHFTVVLWDRQGVGKTFAKNGEPLPGTLTFDRLAADGIALAEHLKSRFPGRPVVLLGHSVGSVIGVLMAKQRPDLFAAYVGTDQIANMRENEQRSYAMLLERTAGDSAQRTSVTEVGPPPYATGKQWLRKQELISATDPTQKSFEKKLFPMIMTAPNYSMQDMMAFGKGLLYSASALCAEMMTRNLYDLGTEFKTPIAFILGERDVIDPTELGVAYYNRIEAPTKRLTIIPGAGHGAMLMTPDTFLAALRKDVMPLLAATR
jgi:pimeloyl-ACP methyl ester carboxylesterase